ncbi:MAG: helix-turn-helix domain-containing protein [Bacteroidota bacterium]
MDSHSMDKIFVEKVNCIIEANLENEHFGVAELASEVGLSSSQLLRKIKSLRGITPNELIKEFRLKEAKRLLVETDYTASEIAYRTGFSSPSYFNKCFHDFYGYPPGEAKLREISEIVEEPFVEPVKASETQNDKDASKKKLVLVSSLAILLFFAISYIIYNYATESVEVDTADIIKDKSIAVLPFKNLSDNKENQYFADGVMDDILNHLSVIKDLKVISRTTMEQFRETQKTAPEIAKELDVSYIIESSIQKHKDSIRITTQMIDAEEDKHVWSKIFDREFKNIFTLESEIARQVAKELKIILSPTEIEQIEKTATKNLEAYEAYVKGKFYWDRLSKDGLEKATNYFKIAIDKDPNWAPPYAGLAEVWVGRMQMGITPPPVAIPKIYENINRALDLDPNSANSHYVKALIAVWTEWNWEKGEKEFLRSIELNPNSAKSHIYYAHFLMIMKRTEEALYQGKLAIELDPQNALNLGLYAVIMKYNGNLEEAIYLSEKALSIDPDNKFAKGQLAAAYNYIGNHEKWFEYWKTVAWWDDEVVASIEEVFLENGYYAAIEEIIRVNEDVRKKGGNISAMGQAGRYLTLNNYDKALEYYEEAYELHNPNMPYISLLSDRYEQLKEHQGYIELLEKMKLPK